jgi:histidinol phosphatase-like PHP family hydrolase
MHPKDTVKIARDVNFGIALVEHAGQLYCKKKDFWNGMFLEKPELIYNQRTNRMDRFIECLENYRNIDVLIGIEVDLNKDGKITLHENHLESWDLIIGAIHFPLKRFRKDIDAWFKWSIEAFTQSPIKVLAHPFRYYHQKKLNRPAHLYDYTIDMLKSNNIAAEVNFHHNNPDPVFFKKCIEEGVKIALGSDSHSLHEVCRFDHYLKFLNTISDGKDLEHILFKFEK